MAKIPFVQTVFFLLYYKNRSVSTYTGRSSEFFPVFRPFPRGFRRGGRPGEAAAGTFFEKNVKGPFLHPKKLV